MRQIEKSQNLHENALFSQPLRHLIRYWMGPLGAISPLLATHHRPSPLIQGGVEIPIKLVVKLTDNEVNNAKLQKYRKFVDENYWEPVDEKFADDAERILKLIGAQNAGPREDDDDEDIEHESDQ